MTTAAQIDQAVAAHHPDPAHNIFHAADCGATQAAVDRLCRLIERYPHLPELSLAAAHAAQTDINTAQEHVTQLDQRLTEQPDADTRYLFEQAQENIQLARRRLGSCLQQTGAVVPTENQSPQDVRLAVEQVRLLARLEQHCTAVRQSPNDRARQAHLQAADMYVEDIIGNHAELADLNHRAEIITDQDESLATLIAAIPEHAVQAHESTITARRRNMPFTPSEGLTAVAERQTIDDIAERFRSTPQHVAFHPVETGDDLNGQASLAIITVYEHEGSIHGKFADEPYPPGFPATVAASHGTALIAQAQRAAMQSGATPVVEACLHAGAFIVQLAQADLHTADLSAMEQLVADARQHDVDPALIYEIISAATQGNPQIAMQLAVQADAHRLVSSQQAKAVIKAAQESGVAPGVVDRIAAAMFTDPEDHDSERPHPSLEAAATVLEHAHRMMLPDEAAIAIAQAMELTAQQALELCAHAGYDTSRYEMR